MTVTVPGTPWFEDGELGSFPDAWRVDVLRMPALPAPAPAWADALAALEVLHGDDCGACVVECASMQSLAP